MKKLALVLCLSLFSFTNANAEDKSKKEPVPVVGGTQTNQVVDPLNRSNILKASSLSRNDLDTLSAAIVRFANHKGIKDTKDFAKHTSDFIDFLNKELKALGATEVLKNSLGSIVTPVFVPGGMIGVEIKDGFNRFCIPCTFQNATANYHWGLIPYSRSKRNPKGKFHKALKCFEALDKLLPIKKSYTNKADFPTQRFMPFPGKHAGQEGVYALTDDTIYFYPFTIPQSPIDPNTFQAELPSKQKVTITMTTDVTTNKAIAIAVADSADLVKKLNAQAKKQGTPLPIKELGIGLGDTVTKESKNAVKKEISDQLKGFDELGKHPYQNRKKPADAVICSVAKSCMSVGKSIKTEMTQKFNCNTKSKGSMTNKMIKKKKITKNKKAKSKAAEKNEETKTENIK